MEWLQTVPVDCAFCGETIEVLVDCSIPEQSYVEDCQVCCRPLLMRVRVDDQGQAHVDAVDENA